MKISENCYKLENTANPISPNVFCADPTGVEYNGRLYIYGTNDHQEYEAVGDDGKNGYAHIKSIVMLSTDDMVNWEYHGFIDVAKIAPWIVNSWAPSVTSRVEADGKTHFYLYFSNSGCGVGVLTAEHPLGPWSDPLGKPLIYQNMPGLENCPAPFDPGVCLDENGTGWLAFGGGTPPASDTLITADEIINLVYSLKRPYRKNAKFIMNDQTIAALRKLKDNNGAYLWQPSLQAGEVDRLFGYEVYTSPYVPTIAAGKPVIAFGDFSYYNIGDRGTRSFAELKELYAGNGMVGFVAKERVDGKLILPEAVQILKMKAGSGSSGG